MEVKNKRNIVLLGHAQSGKTSLAESILSVTGATSRKGDVMQGTSVSDFLDDEKARKSSINSSFLNATYNGHKINVIDAPGYADFIGDAVSSIQAADAAVVVVDAAQGVEVGTDEMWQRLEDAKMPRVIFINKEDKEGAKVEAVMSEIREQLSKSAVAIDLDSSDLMESVAESDDALIEKYLEQGTLTPEEVKTGLRKATVGGKVFPVITGSAISDKNVKELLDYVISYMPSPVERKPYPILGDAEGETKELAQKADGPFIGYIFKSIYDSHLGHLLMMKVVQGTVKTNVDCVNATTSSKEHIGGIIEMQGKDQTTVPQAECGDIVALSKLKSAKVCDVLSEGKDKILFAPMDFPEPSVSASIKPKTRADEEKIAGALSKICEEDLTFKTQRNKETKELIASGVGDLHLKILLDRLKQRYHVEVELGKPKVTYRETISKKGKFRHKYKKQSGGKGQYGDVDLEVEPLPGTDYTKTQYEFVNAIFGGAIPRNYIPSVEKGVIKTLNEGVLAGYPLYNCKVTVVDGSYHEVDSSDMAFQIASAMAMKEAIKAAGPVLLEPIMNVSIVATDEFMGQISGDISSRRGRIMGTEHKGKKEVITAQVPQSELFSYANDLRSMTGGRGSYTMRFSHYEYAPAKITEQVIAESQKAKEES